MKLDIYIDVTHVADWMAVATQIGTLFQVQPEPWRPELVLEKVEPSKSIKKHMLVFSLNGASILTDEQELFFKTYTYSIWFSKMHGTPLDPSRVFPQLK